MAGGGGACVGRPASVGGRGGERGRRVECARGGPPSVGRPVARGGRRGPRREAARTGRRADAGERRRAGVVECPRGAGVVGGEARAGVVECLRGGAVGGEAGGTCGPRREAARVGRRLKGSSGDGRGVGCSSGEEGGVGVAEIHDLVTGSRIDDGWRRRGSLMTIKSKTRSERRKGADVYRRGTFSPGS